MEHITVAYIAGLAAIIIYAGFKVIRFFLTDNTANRYEYQTVEVDGVRFEKVKDRYDNYDDSAEG